jgi:hypothetical protein
MHIKTNLLNNILRDLDRALTRGEVEEVVDSIGRIRLICDDIEHSIQDEIEYVKRRNETLQLKYKHELINEVEFLIKPVSVENVYEGDYLEHFTQMRARQLQDSGAEGAHNTFWTEYLTLHGNVFGSVPTDLIQPGAALALEKNGWKRVLAKVYDFGESLAVTLAFYEFCDEKFGHYIVVQESSTKAYLVLAFEF